jgi:DNA-binding CsgD family transcriptional regulator
LLELLMPHLVEAMTLNRQLQLDRHLPVRPSEMSGNRALVRSNGDMIHCGQGFAQLLGLGISPSALPRLPRTLIDGILRNGEALIGSGRVKIHGYRLGESFLLVAQPVSFMDRLTPREATAAQLFGGGWSYKEVAKSMRVAPATARNMLQNIYRKLHLRNKAQLARLIAKNQT